MEEKTEESERNGTEIHDAETGKTVRLFKNFSLIVINIRKA